MRSWLDTFSVLSDRPEFFWSRSSWGERYTEGMQESRSYSIIVHFNYAELLEKKSNMFRSSYPDVHIYLVGIGKDLISLSPVFWSFGGPAGPVN